MPAENLTLYKPQLLESLEAEYEAFLLDRQAARCTPKTLIHYEYTVGGFVDWLLERGVTSPEDIS